MDRDLSWLINHDHSTTLVYQAPTAMSCSMKDRVEEKGKWPCSTCGAMWCTCGDLMMVIMCGVTGYRLLI